MEQWKKRFLQVTNLAQALTLNNQTPIPATPWLYQRGRLTSTDTSLLWCGMLDEMMCEFTRVFSCCCSSRRRLALVICCVKSSPDLSTATWYQACEDPSNQHAKNKRRVEKDRIWSASSYLQYATSTWEQEHRKQTSSFEKRPSFIHNIRSVNCFLLSSTTCGGRPYIHVRCFKWVNMYTLF